MNTDAASIGRCAPDGDGHCSICGDEALAGLIVSVNNGERTASVHFGDHTAVVALDLLDNAAAGDSVMVHMGFAIALIAGSRK